MVRGAGQGAEAEAELQVALKGVGREQRLVGNKPGRNDGERWASKQPSAAQAKKKLKAGKTGNKKKRVHFLHPCYTKNTDTPNVPIKNAVLGAGPSTKALRGSFTLRSGVEGAEGDGSRGAPLAASRGRARRRVQALATLFGPRPLLPEQVSPLGVVGRRKSSARRCSGSAPPRALAGAGGPSHQAEASGPEGLLAPAGGSDRGQR